MALWKESEKSPSSPLPKTPDATDSAPAAPVAAPPPTKSDASALAGVRGSATSAGESHIAPELVVEGKIEGAGHVRIAGRFKGDINVRGDLTIEDGAKVEGGVRAERVAIAGELTGNIESAAHVELLSTGALTGDVKSGTFTVAKGSRMRGQVEFGWDDSKSGVAVIHKGSHYDTGGTSSSGTGADT